VKHRLEQRPLLGQRLQQKLAPRMIQAMEILHLGLDDLEERVQQELEKNVVLERVESAAPEPGSSSHSRANERHRLSDDAMEARAAMFDQTPSREMSPTDILHEQWQLVECTPAEARLGSFLIENLDGNGFLPDDDETLAKSASDALKEPVAAAGIAALRALLTTELEPVGVAARDRSESLTLQLQRVSRRGVPADVRADALRVLKGSLEDLERNRLPMLAKRHKLPLARLQAIRDLVTSLDPAPLARLNRVSAQAIRPEAYIVYDAERDVYVLAMSRGAKPALRIAPAYERMAAAPETSPEAKAMLKEGIKKANWIIDAIEQRASTLKRVLEEVVLLQREWLDKGRGYLRPMPMTEVAGRIGVAISTVSRAVAGKWVSTPHGMMEIRRFFSGGTVGPEGRPVAWDSVKRKIGDLVRAEDSRHPLSDQAIVRRLGEEGIQLARRTIVKYRESLGIPSSRLRRRHSGESP